jgi:hypothetical protein
MSTNDSEVDVLFATKRKRQQAEEAQKEAQKAEEERIQELERQKKQMLEDIQRLEAEKAQQAAEAEQAAIAARAAQAEREAQAARAAQEAEAARAARAAEAARLAQEAQAAKAAMKAQKAAEAEQRAAAKAMAKASAPAQAGGIKKYLPFIIAGAVAVIAIVVVVIVIATSGSKSSETKTADNDTGSKSKSNIENMSDPPEDEGYEGEGEEIQEYDEDYGLTLDKVLDESEWIYVVDESTSRGFYYPDCFDMSQANGGANYQFSYNGSSTQEVWFNIEFEYLGEEGLKSYIGSTQDDRNHYGNYRVNSIMQQGGIDPSEYTISSETDPYGQEIYYAYTAFDTPSSDGNMYVVYVTWQDGCVITFKAIISKEAEGHSRFADLGDITELYGVILKTITDTSTAKG